MIDSGKLRRAAAASSALLLVLVGCSDGSDAGKRAPAGAEPWAGKGGQGGAGGTTVEAGQVPWAGPALPGLGDKPAWSAPRDRGGNGGPTADKDSVFTVDDAVAIVHEKSVTPGGNGTRRFQVSFHDAKSGALRASTEVGGHISAETWRGRPALVTRDDRKVPDAGLTAAREALVVTAFDAQGSRIASVDLTKSPDSSYVDTVVDGWVVRRGREPDATDDKSHIWVRSADTPEFGPAAATCDEQDTRGCTKPGLSAGPQVLALGTVFTTAYDKATGATHLVASDAATGSRRWTTATVKAPPGTPTDDGDQARAVMLGTVGDKLLLGWYTNEKSNDVVMGRGAMLLGLYDAVSGALTTSGPAPRVQSAYFTYQASPDNTVVYLGNRDKNGPHVVAWQPAGGRLLWQQESSERPLRVWEIVNGALYAAAGESTSFTSRPIVADTVVLNAADKTVLAAPGPAGELIPQVTSTGHGVVATNDRIWVFPPKPVR